MPPTAYFVLPEVTPVAVALYRKYRPRRFCDVLGQDAVTKALRNQTASGRVGHSYIFTGIRGTGKTTFARILAKAVNCLNPQDGEPCGECAVCRGIDDGSILDVSEIDAASNRGVDNIRDLREETSYAPAVCRMRVYIIDEVHMLTTEAFNALLKIMEEPPAHVMFIFATTEVHKVPATILSRCQRYELKRISADEISPALLRISQSEGIDLREDGAALLARLSDGSMRDALSLLDTCSSLGGPVDAGAVARLAGVADRQYLFDTAEMISRGDAAGAIAEAQRLYQNSLAPERLCTELLRHIRDLTLAKLAGVSLLRECSADTAERIKKQSEGFSLPRLMGIMNELSSLADRLAGAPDSALELQLCLLRLCGVGDAPEAPGQAVAPAVKTSVRLPRADGAMPKAAAPPQAGDPLSAAPPARNDDPETGDGATAAAPPMQSDGPAAGTADATAPADVQQRVADDGRAPEDGESGIRPFPSWDRVANAVAGRNGMMGGYLKKTAAYISGDCVLIESDDFFRRLMNERDSSNKAILREAIEEVTGKRYKLGAYTPQNVAATGSAGERERQLDELERLARMV